MTKFLVIQQQPCGYPVYVANTKESAIEWAKQECIKRTEVQSDRIVCNESFIIEGIEAE